MKSSAPSSSGSPSGHEQAMPDKSSSKGSRLTTLACGLFLLVAVFGVFLPALRNGFINYDDDVYVTDNLHVQAGPSRAALAWAFKAFDAGNWHPVTWISHMLDCRFSHLDPGGHHFTSVLLHAINTLLLFLLLRQMTGAVWRSFFVAALFGLHPLHVESVAWVAERKDVLSGLFFLLTLLAYVSYVASPTRNPPHAPTLSRSHAPRSHAPRSHAPRSHAPRSHAPRSHTPTLFYALTFLLYVLGLMSKPMLVTLPFVLLLLDLWPLHRWQPFARSGDMPSPPLPSAQARPALSRLLLEKLPFLLLAVAASRVTWLAQRHGGALESLTRLSLLARFENALVAYCRYLGKLFWPAKLTVFYPTAGPWPPLVVAGALLLLVALSVAFWLARHRQPYCLVGWLWFVGTLVPVIGLVQVGFQSLADRYTYIPSIGIFLIVIWGAHEFVALRWRRRPSVLAAAGACVLLVLAGLTREQAARWRDSGTLFQHALEVTRRNPIAELHLGSFQLLQASKTDEAINHLQAAIAIEPRLPEPYDALGTALYRQGRRPEAIHQFQQAIALKPDYAIAHFNLAVALQAEGRLDDSLREFEQALTLRPDYAEACSGLGVVLAAQGKLDAAVLRFQQALDLNPNLPVVHYNLGLALLKQGQREDAAAQFSQALALNPNYPEARRQLQALKP